MAGRTTSASKWEAGTERQSAAEIAYSSIRDLVVSGALRPGQIINEQELSQRLGIGRTPVREAIQRLALQSVIEVFPRRGHVIAKLGLEDVQSLFEARGAVEEKTAELAAERRSEDEAGLLRQMGERIAEVARDEDFYAFLDADQQLHHFIAGLARNRFLSESADTLLMLSDWVWHGFMHQRGSHHPYYFSHDEIIDAIATRHPQRAREAMREHVYQSREVIRNTW